MWPLPQEGVLGHVRDAGHLATCGPQLSLEISVVRDRQRLGLFLVVKVAAADSLQVRGDRCIDGGPGSLIWGLRGEGRRPGRVSFGSAAHGILGAPTDASFQRGWGWGGSVPGQRSPRRGPAKCKVKLGTQTRHVRAEPCVWRTAARSQRGHGPRGGGPKRTSGHCKWW